MALSTGADSPGKVTHGFTLSGHDLVYAMLEGEKVKSAEGIRIKSKYIENRNVRFAPGWYGVALAKSPRCQNIQTIQDQLPGLAIPVLRDTSVQLATGCIIGIVKISHSLLYDLCKEDPWAVEDYRVCNIISHAGWLTEPVPWRGNLGAYPMADDVKEAVRKHAEAAFDAGLIYETGAEKLHPYRDPSVWRKKRKRTASQGCIDLSDKDENGRLREFLLGATASLASSSMKK